jgi:hypothetical protein
MTQRLVSRTCSTLMRKHSRDHGAYLGMGGGDYLGGGIIELSTEQNDAQAIYERVRRPPKKRMRPPKQTTQSSTSTGIDK